MSFFFWQLSLTIIFSSGVQGLFNLSSSASWDRTGTTVTGQTVCPTGSTADSLRRNRGISISADDVLYIADASNNRIVYVPVNMPVSPQPFGGYGSSITSFNYPCDIHVTNTSIYIMDHGNSRIQKYSINGLVPTTVLTADYIAGSYNMFVDQNENVYVSHFLGHTIIQFMADSSISLLVAGNGSAGSANNQLNGPNGLYVDENQAMYIADALNHRIQKWMPNSTVGSTVAGMTGLPGSSLSQMSAPISVVLDINGYMYIADSGNNRILRWISKAYSGICIAGCTRIGGAQANQLNYPIALTFDSQGSLYVSDFCNNRLQRFQILNNSNEVSTITTTLTNSHMYSQNTSRRNSINPNEISTTFSNSLTTQKNEHSSSNSMKSIAEYIPLCLLIIMFG